MPTSLASQRKTLLLLEPQGQIRGTLAAVARQRAETDEAATPEAAERLIAAQRYDALFVDLDAQGKALELIARVRAGQSRCASDVPIVALAAACDTPTALRLKECEVRRLLLKPFQMKSMMDSLAALWPERATH